MQFRAVKGMNDILPGEVEAWQRLERAFIHSAELHGYSEIRTPLVEPTGLFVRSIGDATDVVQKEMYTFERSDESLTLRPEGTASCVRAYVQHAVHAREPITRWYYLGPMYRAERPQRGRYRQFYQAGCEIYGDPGPACDAELIAMLVDLFSSLGIGNLRVLVNSLGGPESRERYRQMLLEYLRPRSAELTETSQQRLEKNPLRVLDSKAPQDKLVVEGAPPTTAALSAEDRAHWEELRAQLEALGVPYTVDPGLVRGLDYYSRTLFEIQSDAGNLGAQNAIAGGGRYDGLVKTLGGPDAPAIGFAMGLERILLAMGEAAVPARRFCYIAPLGAAAVREGLKLASELRRLGVVVEFDGRDNTLKSKLRRANTMGAAVCAVFGEAELSRGEVQLKDFAGHAQQDVPRAEAATKVCELLSSSSAAGQK
ncbi:MAG: High confidence in function and specificity [Pseudomonadota bacterium]|jgi:histidyl-tRNA synthetase